ncbi:PqiC family protein [Aquabacterium sp. A7-Y]|uniref:PqiC family protein n=1 Tax=Aquabacterium sp. A7-Y TaxID=1349605 RepID=UPI00223CE948|nr:ABC-type transport auxiliary lipoprotein family protein [Aquabacterium sp. A7-Y]MCW7536631.1 PqiC family protein [Aquabacterium sp. A7-Y]
MTLPLLRLLPAAPALRPAGRALLLACAVLAGCAGTRPAATLLTLPPAELRPAEAPAAAAPGPVVSVRRVAIPEYLLTRKVRFRANSSTLAEWPQTYWAERIEVGVTREFVSALRQALPGWTVCEASCNDRVAELALQVDLAPLDLQRSAGMLQSHARVSVSSTAAAAPGAPRVQQLVDRRFEQPSGADTPQGHAQALTDVLEAVAQATADGLRQRVTPVR